MPFAQQKMGFDRPPKLFLRQDSQNAANPMGKTGFYDPERESITLYITDRHPKDIMRSLAHELQHHTQKCNGDFENIQNMGEEGYAQADPHMRTMEIEAYQASIVFRDWEDSTKGTIYYEQLQKGDNSSMSTKDWKNGEIKSLLSEAWGFKMDLSKLTESKEESIEEGFEQPKSATGAGPSNKAGNIGRSDVANKDTSDFGQGGSASGGKPSASGTNTAPKAGKMDRSDVANKVPNAGQLKEEEDADLNEKDELEEGGRAARKENEPEGEERRMKHADRVRESVMRLHNAGFSAKQIKESLTNAFNKAKKG